MALTYITLGIVLVLAVLVFLIYRRMSQLEQDVKHRLDDITLSHTISDLFSKNMGSQNVYILANGVFRKAREQFKLKAKSYSEIIEEVKRTPEMEHTMREALIDFFEQVMLISYQKDQPTEEEKEELKRKVKLIMQMFQKAQR